VLRCQDDAIEDEEMSTMEFPAEAYDLQDEYDSEDEDEDIVVSSYSSRVYSTNSRSTRQSLDSDRRVNVTRSSPPTPHPRPIISRQ
jgi:hypothetical protein